MKTILFQGDSITDAGRLREDEGHLGYGYAAQVKEELELQYPNEYTMYNRGVSGNHVVDLYARIKTDIINLKPDYMSILIGVNDVWHTFDGQENGVEAEKYFRIYSTLIEEIKEALPEIKIMILEPFALKGTGNQAYWEEFHAEVLKRAEKAKAIAKKYGLIFVPLQETFDESLKDSPSEYWLLDGVQPLPTGDELIKQEWMKGFRKLLGEK